MTIRDPLEDEIVWKEGNNDQGYLIESTLRGYGCRRLVDHESYVHSNNPQALVAEARRVVAATLIECVHEGREREKCEADKQFVGAA